ncbi:MAG: caspase family protein [Rhizobiaceae bacterium]
MNVHPPFRLVSAAVAALVLFFAAAVAHAQESLKGVALIIGQSKYEHIPALPNPANDARAMAKLLTDLGFDARSVSDRDAEKLRRDLERFAEDAEGADVAFLYYSGHGIEAGGENWLIPVNADVSSLDHAGDSLVALSAVMEKLKATVPVVVVLLDACRTNPFPADAMVRVSPDAEPAPVSTEGLTPVRGAAPLTGTPAATTDNLGTVIGFAAEPGRPALDGASGGNSPYAAALLRHLGAMNGAEFGAVMRMVTEEVYLDTKAQQRPWVNESLRRMLYFGVAQDEPTGNEGLITGERRKLLLTISDLPLDNRAQVELVASRDGVPLDSLYGVLRAMGTDQIPDDPNELARTLDAQAERLKQMFDRARALDTSDPETKILLASADDALRQGAIDTARSFLDQAVTRVDQNGQNVDDIEEQLRQKRIADAAIYAQRADVQALAYDYAAAASDYRKAFELVEKWDDQLRRDYKNSEAKALLKWSDATGEEAGALAAIDAFNMLLSYIPYGVKNQQWALARTNVAIVLLALAEDDANTARLDEALAIFRETLAVFSQENDDLNWATTQENIGAAYFALSERELGTASLDAAITAFHAALSRRDPAKSPKEWVSSNLQLARALQAQAERTGSAAAVSEAVATYEAALKTYDRQTDPIGWSLVQTSIGGALQFLATLNGDTASARRAVEAFQAVVDVRPKERMPAYWATAQINLGTGYKILGTYEAGTDALGRAEAAYDEALTIVTREKNASLWAAAQMNLGAVRQTLGQRGYDVDKIEGSVEPFRAAQEVYTRAGFPLEWADIEYNLAHTFKLLAVLRSDPAMYEEGAASARRAMEVYTRAETPRQWSLAQAVLGALLQSLFLQKGDLALLDQSADARRAALEIMTRSETPIDWATTQDGLGQVLLNMSTFGRKPEVLPEAMKAFEASLEVFTKEATPTQWALATNNVGDVYWNMAAMGGGKAEYQLAREKFEIARDELKAQGQAGMAVLLDQKIAEVDKQLAKL